MDRFQKDRPVLETPIQYIKGVGPRRRDLFGRIGIKNAGDAIYCLPWRYEDRSAIKKISELIPEKEETIIGTISASDVVVTRRRGLKIFEMAVSDETGMMYAKWFNQPYLKKLFRNGQKVMLSGKVRFRGKGVGGRGSGVKPYTLSPIPYTLHPVPYTLLMENPGFEIIEVGEKEIQEQTPRESLHMGRIVPVYHETYGLNSRQVRHIIKEILDQFLDKIIDPLPDHITVENRLIPLKEAISNVHFPAQGTDIDLLNRGESEAHRRLAFDELFLLELGLAIKKMAASNEEKGVRFNVDGPMSERLIEKLPFKPTNAQLRVINEIRKDMASHHPMNRLIQGDVGSGKTIVAIAAMVIASENGYQAAMMAPTEILAEQHNINMKKIIDSLGIRSCLLVNGMGQKEKKETLKKIAEGEAGIIFGTHAIIQEDVRFKNLGLAVIDEQHKFGVMQRATLKKKGYNPDILIMTATPIPRTLALSLYGDLDISVIDELPPGRSPIETRLFYESKRDEAYSIIRREVAKGRQAYIVYPLIEESEKSDLMAALTMTERLKSNIFPDLSISLIHGKMKSGEKEEVMSQFKEGKIDILAATTVVEVGIDVPNATVMLIEHAERFGLAQLHQLRGRVGRGSQGSYCMLMVSYPLSEEAKKRLSVMVRSQDGFLIAEEDLKIRGPGEFFGTRQSGLPEMRVANIIRDASLLERAREEALKLIAEDPDLSSYPELAANLNKKWKERLELITIS
ncbi:MAG: ATP-dependent DNA helicase RecG [Nitrospirae bacterium]|nr:ATP-dependent DNA helicase RecG [Nitrospirota bacterium]